jgi:putative salt-induced outer membrane protein YdiY
MQRYFCHFLVFATLIYSSVYANGFSDNNTTQDSQNSMIHLDDTSGLSEDEVRQVAKKIDKTTQKKQLLSQEITWENLSPTPKKYDWIQTTSGEWFKGDIIALYDDKLEFDSDEIGVYVFDFDDVKTIKSYQILSVNIENLATISGVVRLYGNKLSVIQGDTHYEFQKDDIVSFAPAGELERNFWSGKMSLAIDLRNGNTNQRDYSAQATLKRRTADATLSFDYLGRISSKDGEQTANDHRLNQKYDRYITRSFFWTPVFSEYYTDTYKNIKHQVTLGLGLGYTLIDTKEVQWSFSGGPAIIYTQYDTVEQNRAKHDYSPALEVSTSYEKELSAITDFTYNAKFTLSDSDAGTYKHHMIFKFENELLSWLDLDITAVWDYVHSPQQGSDGIIPKRDDYQLLVGFGIEF